MIRAGPKGFTAYSSVNVIASGESGRFPWRLSRSGSIPTIWHTGASLFAQ